VERPRSVRILVFLGYAAVAFLLVVPIQGEIIGELVTRVRLIWGVLAWVGFAYLWMRYLKGVLVRTGRPVTLAFLAFVPLANLLVIVVALWWLSGWRVSRPIVYPAGRVQDRPGR
jgi:hypothetical protein